MILWGKQADGFHRTAGVNVVDLEIKLVLFNSVVRKFFINFDIRAEPVFIDSTYSFIRCWMSSAEHLWLYCLNFSVSSYRGMDAKASSKSSRLGNERMVSGTPTEPITALEMTSRRCSGCVSLDCSRTETDFLSQTLVCFKEF